MLPSRFEEVRKDTKSCVCPGDRNTIEVQTISMHGCSGAAGSRLVGLHPRVISVDLRQSVVVPCLCKAAFQRFPMQLMLIPESFVQRVYSDWLERPDGRMPETPPERQLVEVGVRRCAADDSVAMPTVSAGGFVWGFRQLLNNPFWPRTRCPEG